MSVPVPDVPTPGEIIAAAALGILETLTEIALYPFAAVMAAFIAQGPLPWWAWARLAVMAAVIVALPVALACLAWSRMPRGRQGRKGGPPNARGRQ